MSPCERCNPLNGEFSATAIQCASCPRKYLYQKLLKYCPATVPIPLNFGIAIHEAVKTFYDFRKTMEYDKAKIEAVRKFIEVWNEFGYMGDEKRNATNGILIINNYCEFYKDDVADFDAERLECAQWISMPNNTMLLAKFDRVRDQDGCIRVTDTKTTSGYIGEYYMKGWENNFQFGVYFYAIKQIFGRCDSIQVDAIKVPPPGPKSKAEPFGRRDYYYTEHQLDEIVNSYIRKTDFLMGGMHLPIEEQLKYYYQEHSHCADYGGCWAKPLCMYGIDNPMAMSNVKIGG